MTGLISLRGQEGAWGLLTAALEAGRVPHAYLFVGPEGTGKHTAALAWAQILLCARPETRTTACGVCVACQKVQAGAHPDLLEVGFARQAALLKEPVEKQKSLKIDTLRDMERLLRFRPVEGRVKVALLDPADELVDAAAHALLKILEEPPPDTHLVLIVREATALLPTLRSRCQWVRFRPLAQGPLTDILRALRPDLTEEDLSRAVAGAEGSAALALKRAEGVEALGFSWETAALSELLSWCEGFGNPRLGRTAAERFLEGLLADLRKKLRTGASDREEVWQALTALHRLRQNAQVTLVLQSLLLTLRRKSREKSNARTPRASMEIPT